MTKAASAWMPFYVGDYLGDTQRLTTEQHGAYLLLLLDYWRNGPAPDDDVVLRQIVKLDTAAWKRNRPALARMFQVADGLWTHKRVEAELTAARDNQERRSGKAKAAAQARWGDAKGNAPSMPQALPVECPPPSPSPVVSDKSLTPDALRVVSAWNDMAKKAGLPGASPKPIAKRDTSIKQRIGEHGVDAILAGFVMVPQSKFLMGGGNTGWRANLNDMLRPANMAKLIDGSYHTEAERASLGAAAKTLEERIAWFEEQAALMERIKNFDTAKSFMATAAELRAQQEKENGNG